MQDHEQEIGTSRVEDAAAVAQTEADLRAFRAHWEACRDGADVPRRAAIDPRAITPLLSNAFIAERVAPGVVRLRVAGLHLRDLMGMEPRGMPLSAFIAPDDRAAFGQHLVDLFDMPAILRMALQSRGAFRRPKLSGTLMLLPLRSDLGDVSRALGCLVSHGPIGRPVRRFAISRVETLPVSAAPLGATPPLRAIAGGANGGARGRAHLRVVT